MILETRGLLEGTEAANEVAVVAPPAIADLVEAMAVHLRELVEGAVFPPGAVDLLLGELDEPIELHGVALFEEVVAHHLEEGRAERHRHSEIDVVVREALESEEQRGVRLGDGLEEPLLLHVGGSFRMPHERQVRVQNDRKKSVRHDHRSPSGRNAHFSGTPVAPAGRGACSLAPGCSLPPSHSLPPSAARHRSLAPPRSLAPA